MAHIPGVKTYGKRVLRRANVESRGVSGVFPTSLLEDRAVFNDSMVVAGIKRNGPNVHCRNHLKNWTKPPSLLQQESKSVVGTSAAEPDPQKYLQCKSISSATGGSGFSTETYTRSGSCFAIELSDKLSSQIEETVNGTEDNGEVDSPCTDMDSEDNNQKGGEYSSDDSSQCSEPSIEMLRKQDAEVCDFEGPLHMDLYHITDSKPNKEALPSTSLIHKAADEPPLNQSFCSSILPGNEQRAIEAHRQPLELSPIRASELDEGTPVKFVKHQLGGLKNGLENTPTSTDIVTGTAKRPQKGSKFGPAKAKKPKIACSTLLFTSSDPCKPLNDYFPDVSSVNVNCFDEPPSDRGDQGLSQSPSIQLPATCTSNKTLRPKISPRLMLEQSPPVHKKTKKILINPDLKDLTQPRQISSPYDFTSSHDETQSNILPPKRTRHDNSLPKCKSAKKQKKCSALSLRNSKNNLKNICTAGPPQTVINPDLKDLTPPRGIPCPESLSLSPTVLLPEKYGTPSNTKHPKNDKALPKGKNGKKTAEAKDLKSVQQSRKRNNKNKAETEKQNVKPHSYKASDGTENQKKLNSKPPICSIVSFSKPPVKKFQLLQWKEPVKRNIRDVPLDVLLNF